MERQSSTMALLPQKCMKKSPPFQFVVIYLFISDHCPILFEIRATSRKTIPVTNLKESPKFFKIKTEDHEKLVNALKTPGMETRLSSLANQEINPQGLASEITNILLDACELADIKPVRIKTQKNGSNKPWFDKDCQKLKKFN